MKKVWKNVSVLFLLLLFALYGCGNSVKTGTGAGTETKAPTTAVSQEMTSAVTKDVSETTGSTTAQGKQEKTEKAESTGAVQTGGQKTTESTKVHTDGTTTVKQTQKKTCTVTITCANVLSNLNKLKAGKQAFIPSQGNILTTTTVTFSDGETAFDILKRVCRENQCCDQCKYCQKNGIQLEYSYTPAFDSYYVEGIHQLYEKDCGTKSGWLYSINGTFPNIGSSIYKVKNGDDIHWIFTCNLGEDAGVENLEGA